MTAPSVELGIRVVYRETAFRSRLEARWAAFFDVIGWRWSYEPMETGNWIPDFLIEGEAPFLVEVGPLATGADFDIKASKPAAYHAMPTLVVGLSPDVLRRPHHPYAGRLVNEFGNNGQAPCFWVWCNVCRSLRIYGDDRQRPCDHSLSDCDDYDATLSAAWSKAHRAVRWVP